MSVRVTALSSPRLARWSHVALFAILASCSSLAGDVSRGRYTAPGRLFSLPVPALSPGATTRDQSDKNPETKLAAGRVWFHDDLGALRVIEYELVPAELVQRFSDPASASGALRGCTRDVLLGGIREFSTMAQILREESVALADGVTGWFAVLEIRGGSPMVETSALNPEGRRLDSVRGFLLLCRANGLFLTLSAANDHARSPQPFGGIGPDPGEMDTLKDTLTKLYSSMSFP